MTYPKCFECSYPTKETLAIVPNGKLLPLCKFCQKKINKPRSAMAVLLEDFEFPSKPNSLGRPPRWEEQHSESAKVLFKENLQIKDIAERLGFSYSTTLNKLRKMGLI